MDEADRIKLPDAEDFKFSEAEQEVLRKPSGEADDEKKSIRQKYDEKALAQAKELLAFNLVRNANLYSSFRSQLVTRRGSKGEGLKEEQSDVLLDDEENLDNTQTPAESNPNASEAAGEQTAVQQ